MTENLSNNKFENEPLASLIPDSNSHIRNDIGIVQPTHSKHAFHKAAHQPRFVDFGDSNQLYGTEMHQPEGALHFAESNAYKPKPYYLASDDPAPSDGNPLDFDGKKYIVKSAEKPHSHKVIEEPDTPGRKVLRFEVRHGDFWSKADAEATSHPKNRAEVSTNTFDSIGSTYDYSFDIKLPSNFPIEDKRLVLAQWWQAAHKSPPLSIRYENGALKFTLRLPGDDPKSAHYKSPPFKFEPGFDPKKTLKLGEWNDFKVKVKWSDKSDGRIEIWLDGRRVAYYDGPTCRPGTRGPVFKCGIYRDDSAKTYIAYYRDINRKPVPSDEKT